MKALRDKWNESWQRVRQVHHNDDTTKQLYIQLNKTGKTLKKSEKQIVKNILLVFLGLSRYNIPICFRKKCYRSFVLEYYLHLLMKSF